MGLTHDEKVDEWLTTAAAVADFIGLRRRPHSFLGSAGRLAGQEKFANNDDRIDIPGKGVTSTRTLLISLL